MLDPADRRAIEGLFDRLARVEQTADPRDPEAEALIRDEMERQPAAAYYMAQTILGQENALNLADQRIRELEAEAARRRNDVFGGLFGGDRRQDRNVPAPQPGPWDDTRRGAGGGFLAGAAQTAIGVAGGVLLGSAIAGMLGAGAAQADEVQPLPEQEPDPAADPGADDFGGGDDLGSGFDLGGDF